MLCVLSVGQWYGWCLVGRPRPFCFVGRSMGFFVLSIGRWYAILQFLNIVGVITNAFLIAYVSRWGTRYDNDPELQLWIVLGFEVRSDAIC